MPDLLFPSTCLDSGVSEKLTGLLSVGSFWGPVQSEDGITRLQPVKSGEIALKGAITRIPVKKILLPQEESLWIYLNGTFHSSPEPESVVVVGLPLCDMQALWYLDQIFSDDNHYMKRRHCLVTVAGPCEPGPHCHCDGNLMPLSGDLFMGDDRVWALSPKGEDLIKKVATETIRVMSLPWPTPGRLKQNTMNLEKWESLKDDSLWSREGNKCLSCGACSAVCPTCYCFDLIDCASMDGQVTRKRVWDNCFFEEHAKIAGGMNFRASRAARLQFRIEHKIFGFGTMRGQDSCVGCGRCLQACPVEIDLVSILEELETRGQDHE